MSATETPEIGTLAPQDPRTLAAAGETAGAAVAAQAQALIAARYTMALQRPRNWEQVRVDLLKECKRPSFAETAWYRKPVGNGVEGLSIRFAEAAVKAMRNVFVDTISVFDSAEIRILRTSVTDLESNVAYSLDTTIEKTVERRKVKDGDIVLRERINSVGEKVYIIQAIEDQLLNKQGALISKAMRGCVLRILPGDIADECETEILKTRQSKVAKDPDAYKRQIIDGFVSIGVTADQLQEYVGHPLDTLVPAEILALQATYQAIKDSETTWKSVMEAKEEGKVVDAVRKQEERLKTKVAQPQAGAAASAQSQASTSKPAAGDGTLGLDPKGADKK